MALDLVIRNGTVVDGTGATSRRGDVGTVGDGVVSVGVVEDRAHCEVDASGRLLRAGR